MDTKTEQEVFGYDPSNPDGLDDLHAHIHTEWPELGENQGGLARGEFQAIGTGRGKSLTELHAIDFRRLEELFGAAVADGVVPQTDLQAALSDPSLSQTERFRLKEIAFLDNYGVSGEELASILTGTRTGRFHGTQPQQQNVPRK